MASTRRRVSYVIPPPPSCSVPRLSLPPLGTSRQGRTGPILRYRKDHDPSKLNTAACVPGHPRHRLGVAAFALDKSTQLDGRPTPEGILYTGGRDGMILSWDLGIAMKRRTHRYGAFSHDNGGPRRAGRWETLTRDDDDDNAIFEEDDDDDWPTSDGDVIGDVIKDSEGRRRTRYWAKQTEIPLEEQWETDMSLFEPGQPTHWRQSTQAHTDWINDILLCNSNQTVISGSSDGTVKAWNPHSSGPTLPSTVGTHADYVRCLTQSRGRNWIASGSFDRTIKLWDIAQPHTDPIVTLVPPESSGPKSSVYAIATEPSGNSLASGGPERVVRLWDTRSGKRTGKLVGHTDNIRAILMSEDSKYLLTGSADASVKLWSLLSPQRCIYTFTHHTESVWSLFSPHPSLEVFYSGDRSGLVSRVDVEGADRVSDGECIVLCRDRDEPTSSDEGVSKIIAMDDNLMWTASGKSSVRRWKIPQGRIARSLASEFGSPIQESFSPTSPRADSISGFPPRSPTYAEQHGTQRSRGLSTAPSITASLVSSTSSLHGDEKNENSDFILNGIPYESLVRLSVPNTHHLHGSFSISRTREADVSTLYSAASIMSVPRQVRSPSSGTFSGRGHANSHSRGDSLVPPTPEGLQFAIPSARAAYEDRDVAPDATPLASEPDEVIEGEHGLVRVMIMNDRMHALTVDTAGSVAVWDIMRGNCVGIFTREDVLNASAGGSVSTNSTANERKEAEKSSPRQALETVRERIEGEAVVLPWASADTKIGELTIQLMDRCFESEIFADEAGYGPERPFNDEHRLNLGKWVLRNLFSEFIREEQRLVLRQAHDARGQPSAYKGAQWGLSPAAHPRSASENAPEVRTPVPDNFARDANARLSTRVADMKLHGLSPIAQSPSSGAGSEAPTPRPITRSGLATAPVLPESATSTAPPIPPPLTAAPSGASSTAASTNTATSNIDYFSLRRRPSTAQSASTAGQTTPDDFSGWGGPGSAKQHEGGPQTPSTPGGFMGRLKSFTKASRRAATEAETPASTGLADAGEGDGISSSPPKTFIERLKSQPLTPLPPSEAPPLALPPNISVVISEESESGWTPIYRGTVGQLGADVAPLEDAMPEWLLEFLLTGKAPAVPVSKVSFVLLPSPIPPAMRAEYGETLPELLNTSQSKLSASRFLRVRKLTYHVQEKLDKSSPASPLNSPSPRSSSETVPRRSALAPSSPRPSSSPSNGVHPPAFAAAANESAGSTTPRLSPSALPSTGNSVAGHAAPIGAGTSPEAGAGSHSHVRAEDQYEILCNEQVLPLDMTLAAVRQFVWRQAGELVMHYRRRPHSLSVSAAAVGQAV